MFKIPKNNSNCSFQEIAKYKKDATGKLLFVESDTVKQRIVRMENLQKHFDRIFTEGLLNLTLSNKQTAEQQLQKAVVRPVTVKKKQMYQLEQFTKTQAFHENFTQKELMKKLQELFLQDFKQANGKTKLSEFQLKRSKKGKVFAAFKESKTNIQNLLTHNNQKKYILKEGVPVPALVELGVMTPEGKVKSAHYNKFKQINKFLELVEHSVKDETEPLHIIDFGCGKSYLTFVMYYYFREIKKQKVTMVGLDLKADVIAHCEKIAEKFGYEDLKFQVGDIGDYKTEKKVDMVVTLHACDTATDIAMYHAIRWGVKYLFSVPCCQHEINSQISSDTLKLVTNYGILKERFSAVATDAVRAALLESMGYRVDIVEFVDFSHSPKNLLIRCKKTKISETKAKEKQKQARKLLEELGSKQTLYNLLAENKLLKGE